MAAASGSVTMVTSSRSASRIDWRSRSFLYEPQLAGWVTVTASGAPPSLSVTLATTQASTLLISVSAA
jgi:hypothetical protein